MFYHHGILVHPEELTDGWIDRMHAAGLDTLGLHPVGGRNAHLSLQRAIDAHGGESSTLLRKKAQSLGMTVEYEAHVMRWLLPGELFETHPDWFRVDENGNRNPDHNLCCSNEEALAYVGARAVRLAQALDTGARDYCYWLDDVRGSVCRCEKCRDLSPSDQQLRILNAILRALKSWDGNARLCYIAYTDFMAPPVQTEPEDGIFLEYAPFDRSMDHALEDRDCEQNRQIISTLPDLIRFFGTGHSRVLEYWMDNSRFSNWTRPPKPFTLNRAVLERDAAFYDKFGFELITSFGCYLGPDYDALYGPTDLNAYAAALRGGR